MYILTLKQSMLSFEHKFQASNRLCLNVENISSKHHLVMNMSAEEATDAVQYINASPLPDKHKAELVNIVSNTLTALGAHMVGCQQNLSREQRA